MKEPIIIDVLFLIIYSFSRLSKSRESAASILEDSLACKIRLIEFEKRRVKEFDTISTRFPDPVDLLQSSRTMPVQAVGVGMYLLVLLPFIYIIFILSLYGNVKHLYRLLLSEKRRSSFQNQLLEKISLLEVKQFCFSILCIWRLYNHALCFVIF